MDKKVKKPTIIIKYGWTSTEKIIQYLDWRESVQDEPCDEYNAGYNDGIKEEFEKLRAILRDRSGKDEKDIPNS